jgi:para-nitrobenzyl esterase
MTDAAALSRRADVVVVAANYRVGALGFLHAPDAYPPDAPAPDVANLGLQDQIAALRWTRQSVRAFGGDPENVTVMGESAGAFCVGALLAAPAAAGLFDQAILQSGSTGRVFDADTGRAIAADLFSAVGVADVDELRGVPGQRILDAQAAVIDRDIGRRNLPGGHAWGIVRDGSVVTDDPQAVVERGGAAHIPLLVTTTRDEARLFEVFLEGSYAPRDEGALLAEIRSAGIDDAGALLADYRARSPAANLARLRSAFLTDVIYGWPARRLAAAQVAAGGRAYLALFTAEPFGPDLGACHGSDLTYVFDKTAGSLFPLPDTPHDHAVRDQVMSAWARFAATGDPGWDVYQPGAENTCRHFGGTAGQGRPPGSE